MYREIFDNVDAGFCIIDMVFEGNRPTDYIFRVTNEAFQRYTGLSEVANVSMRSLRADHEQEWF
ncbi:hypothetical protein RF142_07180, partial [Escherichia coli]